jgi:hypothetical protein
MNPRDKFHLTTRHLKQAEQNTQRDGNDEEASYADHAPRPPMPSLVNSEICRQTGGDQYGQDSSNPEPIGQEGVKCGHQILVPVDAALHMIASGIRAAACTASPEWGACLLVSVKQVIGEFLQGITIICAPARPTEVNELVRVDCKRLDAVAARNEVVSLLRMELEPLIIGAGYVRVHESAKGIVVIGLNERDAECWHGALLLRPLAEKVELHLSVVNDD